LELPREARSLLVFKEANILPASILIREEAAKYIVRKATKENTTEAVKSIERDLVKDPEVFPAITWTIAMARIQNEYKIPKLSQAAFELTVPWEYKELNILITNDVNKKTSPETAAIEANKRIEQLKCPGTKHVYTDATRKKNGITSWAVVTEKETIDFGRLPDNTPITLAELMAIKEAIDWFQTNEKVDQHLVIHTDSMAALQTLQNIKEYRISRSLK